MRKFFYFLLSAVIVLPFVSCSKDSNKEIDPLNELLNYKYSELSPEKQKEKLQQDANNFLLEMDGLQNNEALNVLNELNALFAISSPNDESKEDLLFGSEMYGKYTWNASSNDWDFVKSDKQLEYNFPVGGKQAKVTQVATFYNTSESTFPKEMTTEIYLASTKVGTVKASSEMQAKAAMPSVAHLSCNFGEYTMNTHASLEHNTVTSAFKKGNKTLIDAAANVAGDWLNLVMEDVETIPNVNGNAIIKINDCLAFAGRIDYGKILQADKQANEQWEKDYAAYGHEKADANYDKASVKTFNDFTEMYLVSLVEKTKIARLAMQNSSKKGQVSVLKFNDETSIETEVFFSSGFETFMDNFSKFIKHFNNQ